MDDFDNKARQYRSLPLFYLLFFQIILNQAFDDFIGIGLLSYCLQFQLFNHFFINCGSEFLPNVQHLLNSNTYIRISYPFDLILAL